MKWAVIFPDFSNNFIFNSLSDDTKERIFFSAYEVIKSDVQRMVKGTLQPQK